DQDRDERPSLPLRHLSQNPDRDPEGRGRDGEGWEVAMTEFLQKEFSRRSFVKGGGALIVGFSLAGGAVAGKAGAVNGVTAGSLPDPGQLDSWIRVNSNNTVNLLTSQIEVGNGITTGFLQVLAEELDMDMSQMIYGTSVQGSSGALTSTVDT